MFERWFRLREAGTTWRTELLGGTITFLAMAYIVVVQPAVMSGLALGAPTGMPLGALTTATCLSAAVASVLMGLYARYPIALAPGMGQNFFFVSLLSTAAVSQAAAGGEPWRVVLGVVFLSGVLFVLISLTPLRTMLFAAVSPSMKSAMAAGIGLFIAFIGLQSGRLVEANPGTLVHLSARLDSPDVWIFFAGLMLAAVLQTRRVPGALLWAVAGAALLAILLRVAYDHRMLPERIMALAADSQLVTRFEIAERVVAQPPSVGPLWMAFDLRAALSWSLWPYVVIFLFMDMFDTMGTLIGVGQRAGLLRDNQLPRAREAMLSDSVGTLAGSCLGMSTVTCFIESAAGVMAGARTGLAALVTAGWFLVAMCFSPLVAMIGGYPPITAPALVIVGAMMAASARNIEWDEFGEALPAFLTIVGIPLFYSIADGVSLGLLSYTLVNLLGGRRQVVRPLMWGLAALLAVYFLWIRGG